MEKTKDLRTDPGGTLTFRGQGEEEKPKKPVRQKQTQENMVSQKPTERGFPERSGERFEQC